MQNCIGIGMRNYQLKFIKQYASGVVDFSSQYGGENPRSFSYSVANIVGEPRIFPTYGDFTQAAVLRMYGPWWKTSKAEERKRIDCRPRPNQFYSTDYIDLVFEKAVYPWSIAIYETYNPGAVARILALRQTFPFINPRETDAENQPIPLPISPGCTHWEVLWESNNPENNLPAAPNESRMFAPILREMKYPCRIIRLEFCSTHLQYYTELDAVELTGTLNYCTSTSVDPPTELVEKLSLSDGVGVDQPLGGSQSENDIKIANNDGLTDISEYENAKVSADNGYFQMLPPELLRHIFSLLPLPDLCRCAMVCRLFRDLSYDPTQYTTMDLSSCWHIINDNALSSLVSRCSIDRSVPLPDDQEKPALTSAVQAVDLSWYGGGDIASTSTLNSFIENCGSAVLTHLTLASSPAVSDDVLKKIAHHCPNLSYLDIQSCDKATPEGIRILHKLSQLTTVNFYRTKIDDAGIICISHSNRKIKHLNLGSCQQIHDYDRVLLELAQHCPNLSTLDCWRARSLTSMGLNAISTCCNYIEELDLGWCGTLQSSSGCFQMLTSHCPHLAKLYVTANRTISDAEIDSLARNCPKLEKLDILGTRLVTVPAMQRLLESCKQLRFLDVSFCFAFTKDVVESLRKSFPEVSIKRSFQEDG